MYRLRRFFFRSQRMLMRGIELFQENSLMVHSGNATLFIVTALFPFIMLIIAIVNLLPGYSTNDLMDMLFRVLPDLEPIRAMVGSMVTNLKQQSGGLLASAAALTTLWSASNGVSAIQKGLNQLEQSGSYAEQERDNQITRKGINVIKSILKRLVFTLILVILIPALLVFEMLGSSIEGIIRAIVEKLGAEGLNETLDKVDSFFHTSSLIVIVFALLVILLLYTILPTRHKTFKSQLPGTLFTGICWFAFTKLFSYFIPRFYHASRLYGSLASLFLVLLWLRIMVMILFAGAVFNHTLEEAREER